MFIKIGNVNILVWWGRIIICFFNCLFLKIYEIYINKYLFNFITFMINKRFLSGYDIILYIWLNNFLFVVNDIWLIYYYGSGIKYKSC